MACFMACNVEDEVEEGRKRTFMFVVHRFVNRIRHMKSCSVSCSAEQKKKGDRKRSCFVAMLLTIRNRYKNRTGGGANGNI